MIDVIIPAYNAHDTICETLSSLVMQSIKDKLNVYIVNDCSSKNYSKIVKKFSSMLNIKEIKTPKNSGPGFSRQLGIDSSNSEYLVFIDSDDVFYDYLSIEKLYNTIVKSNSNVVSGKFIEEVNGGVIIHENDDIWMHAKIFRRSFLDDTNIRFNDTYSNEDTGFNNLIKLCTTLHLIDDIIYVWRCNPKSITRASEYNFWGMEGFAYNICWAIRQAEEKKCNKSKMAKLLYETMLEMYYRYVFYKVIRPDADDVLKWCVDLKKLYLKYENDLSYLTKEKSVYTIFSKMYSILGCSTVVLNNDLSFYKFLDMIKD